MGHDVDIRIAIDDDLAAEHIHTDIRAGIALNKDLTTGHASPVAAVGSTEVVAGIALNRDLATLHGKPGKCRDTALRKDLAPLHPGTDVLVGSALNDHLASGHLEAEVLDFLHVTLDNDLCVGRSCTCIAAHFKVLAEG